MRALVADREAPGFYGAGLPQVPGPTLRVQRERQPHSPWYKLIAFYPVDEEEAGAVPRYKIVPTFHPNEALPDVRLATYYGSAARREWATCGGVVALAARARQRDRDQERWQGQGLALWDRTPTSITARGGFRLGVKPLRALAGSMLAIGLGFLGATIVAVVPLPGGHVAFALSARL